MRAGAVLLAALVAAPVLAGDRDGPPRVRGTDPAPAPVSTQTWRNATLERTRKLVLEVIEKVRSLHVDGDSLSADRMREDAIEALREHTGTRSFHLLDGEARERFRRALQHVPDGDLDACLAIVDQNLVLRTPEEAWTISDVLARGALWSTGDPYTQLIDGRTVTRLAEVMVGKRPAGYGLKVVPREFGVFMVEHVFRGYDAFEKGIQDGDTVVEVDGRPTVLSTSEEIQRRLAGDTKVRLRIWREGFAHGHDVEIEARSPNGAAVTGELLPGGIGYARLDAFTEQTPAELGGLLHRLDQKGQKALILDLRDNPGGSMESCAAVAGLFLGPEKPVCRMTERESGVLATKVVNTRGEAVLSTRTPIVVLTNRGSASASEMLAGALRDDGEGRVRLLGTRTFGKGVGQSPVPLMSALGERFLLISTLRYRSPADHSPQKDGIEPDVVVPRFAYSAAEQEELLRLNSEGAFDRYLMDHGALDAEALLAAAHDDEGKVERYPGFEPWAKGIATTLDTKILRRALRAAIRAWAERKHDRAFRVDLEDDIPLRSAFDRLTAELARIAPPTPEPPQPRKFY